MRQHALDGAGGGDQRLTDDLAAEHALCADLRAGAAEQVHFELFEVEDGEEVCDGGGHLQHFDRSGIVPQWPRLSTRPSTRRSATPCDPRPDPASAPMC